MSSVVLFSEDIAHERVTGSLINRLSEESGIEVTVRPLSVRGGYGRVTSELKKYLRDLNEGLLPTPEGLVIATDANCVGYVARRNAIMEVVSGYPALIPEAAIVVAVPDPHVERWLLVDSAAFRSVLGTGCAAPDQKCERDRYKQFLSDAVREAGRTPIFGGIEYASDIVEAMDLRPRQGLDSSLGRFVADIRLAMRHWTGD